MKNKTIFAILACLILAVVIISCSKKKDDSPSPAPTQQTKNYFSIANATYFTSALPATTSQEEPHVVMGDTVVPGSNHYVDVGTFADVQKIYVSVGGASGYYAVEPVLANKQNVYEFVLEMAQSLKESYIDISVGIRDEFGAVSEYISTRVQIKASGKD